MREDEVIIRETGEEAREEVVPTVRVALIPLYFFALRQSRGKPTSSTRSSVPRRIENLPLSE